jgi:hypothetical protein
MSLEKKSFRPSPFLICDGGTFWNPYPDTRVFEDNACKGEAVDVDMFLWPSAAQRNCSLPRGSAPVPTWRCSCATRKTMSS